MYGDSGERRDEDSGWRLNWRVLFMALPGGKLLYRRPMKGDVLIGLRNTYASFPLALVVFAVVLPFILPFRGDSDAWLWALGIGVVALLLYFIVPTIGGPLRCESDATLSGHFRTRMFLRIAFGNVTALLGFTAAFITRSSWVYYACLLFSVPALVRAAPTKGALVREQDDLTARGCDRSLVAALRTPPPSPK